MTAQYKNGPNDGVIVDLSDPNRLNALMANQDISHLFTETDHARIIDYMWAAFEMSHHHISKRYDHWAEADRAHDIYVPPDATRFREKAVIADTRAVADTVITYLMSAITGRNPIFQIEGGDRKSRQVAAITERLLHKNTRAFGGEARLAQMFLDSTRYGFAPTKNTWDSNRNANVISNFDPRRAFPDPRVNWGDWQRMQFIGFSDFASFDALKQTKLYPSLYTDPELRKDRSPASGQRFNANKWQRETGRAFSIDPQLIKSQSSERHYSLGTARAVNELWVRLSGADINVPSIDEIWLVITCIDEAKVIRFQLNPYGRQFPMVLGGLYNDFHKTYSQSLYDLMLPLHNISTWLLRSRIDNVQAALNNLIFADPTQVNLTDLIDRNPWGIVRTLPGAKVGDGIMVQQVPDVTKGHWTDINMMSDQKQRVAAASDLQQGMPTADVRSATEIQRLSMMGTKRLGMLSRVMSATTIRPLVEMQIQNLQIELADNYTDSLRIDPYNTPGVLADRIDDGYLEFTAEDIRGNVDYLIIDGTLPSEPSRDPKTWMDSIQIMSQTGLGEEYKLGMLAEEAIRGLGVNDLDKFRITKEERAEGRSPSQEFALKEQMRGANVQPAENVMREVEKGNLVSMNAGAQNG